MALLFRLLLLLTMATSDYVFVNFVDTTENVYADAAGAVASLGPASAGTVMNFSSPTAVIGQPVDNMTTGKFYLTGWSNLVLAGREFVTRMTKNRPMVVYVFATEAAAVVTVTTNGDLYTTLAVAAGTVEVITGDLHTHQELQFRSTADVLISSSAVGTAYTTVPPAAETVFGQCSGECSLSVLGGDSSVDSSVNITRSCTNGTVEQVQPGDFRDEAAWRGATCLWSAPEGYKISRRTSTDGTGSGGVSFIAARYFHRVTPLPAEMKSVLLISDSPAVCSRSDGGSVSLTGAVGVFHALLTWVPAGVVLECDVPVTVIADALTPADFPYTDSAAKETNLVMLAYSTTTTTTATASSSTATTLTASNTTTTSSTATNTTVTSTATTTATTATATATSTNTTTTATSTSNTSTASTVTTTTATSTSDTSTASTVTTATATGTTMTATGPTTTATATTATDTSVSSTATATNVTTTATATSVSATATNVTTTATATTVSSMATNVTTTVTATNVTTTATATTTSGTATTTATATVPTTRTTATASSSTTITSSRSTVTSSTATHTPTQTATTSTGTSTATTATTSTSSETTSTATTETATTSTETLTTVTSTSSTSTSDTSTTATGTSATVTSTTTTLSATSTTTPTVLGTTTATTTTVTTLPIASVIVQRVESIEGSVLEAALDTNDTTTSTVQVGNFTLTAARIDADAVDAAGGSLTVIVEGTEAAVTVPASMLDSVVEPDGTVLVVTAFDSATSDSLSSTGEASSEVKPTLEVKAAMNVNLFNLRGDRLAVDGLVEPIKVVMPVNLTDGIRCVWWDEVASEWSTDGVQLADSEDGLVVCETFHLTLFAAILQGFTQTFLCSQLALLNREAIEELQKGDWPLTPTAIVMWCLILFFLLLLSVAAFLDMMRTRRGMYDVEHLLVPIKTEMEVENPVHTRSLTRADAAAGCAQCSCWLAQLCHSSAAVREALDDVVSNWVSHFSEIRDFVEGLCGELECCSAHSRGGVSTVVHGLMTKTLTMSAQRQAAAAVGISQDVSCALMEHKDIKHVLLAHHTRGLAVSPPREEVWGTLHGKVEDKLDDFMEATVRWSALPGTIWRLFCWQTPFGGCLVHCAFRTSKLRVLLFMVEIVGALMLGTVFFQATGVPGKRNRSVDCSFDEAYKLIGRIVAIGTGSIVLSGVPAIILDSLCTKDVMKFEYEGCPQWNRQLQIWRTQTAMIWVFGLLYVAFCMFFMALFAANVRVEDHFSWLLSGFISVVEDTIVIPLSIATSIPLLGAVCLSLISRHQKINKADLVHERCMQIKRQGNMTLALQQI